jgi:type I restriction enzyme S subunit
MKLEKLGNIATIKTGKYDVNHSTPDGEYVFYTCAFGQFKSPTFSFEGPAIILPGNGANVGEVFYYDGKFEAYQRTYVVQNFKADPNYIYAYFKAQWKNSLRNKQFGSATNYIRLNNLTDFTIPVPSLPDQLHIANLLSKAENLIAQRKESIQLLDEFLKSTFLEMFGDAVKNNKKWNETELKNYAKVRIGPFGSLLHREDYVQNGVPLVNPSHICEGKIFIDSELTISKNKMKELSAYVMHEGDVVLGRRGEIGRCAVVTKKEDGYLCGTGSIFIRPTGELNPIFLYNIISSASIRKVLENSAKGITMKNLNSGIIENLKVPVPPIELQTQFAHIVEKTEALKTQYQQSLTELENLYGSLSQKAFKGELTSKKNETIEQ